MVSRNWEDWAMALPLIAVVGLALVIGGVRAPDFASVAVAAEQPQRYVMTVTAKREDKKFVTLACEIVNQHGKAVVSGEAVIMAPTEKQQVELPELPAITIAGSRSVSGP